MNIGLKATKNPNRAKVDLRQAFLKKRKPAKATEARQILKMQGPKTSIDKMR